VQSRQASVQFAALSVQELASVGSFGWLLTSVGFFGWSLTSVGFFGWLLTSVGSFGWLPFDDSFQYA